MYYVNGTYRKDPCNDSSLIEGLVLDKTYNGFTVHSIENLKILADQGQIQVYSPKVFRNVNVIIYYSWSHQRYIATTERDGLECNNLLSLPIYYPSSRNGTTTNYSQCNL